MCFFLYHFFFFCAQLPMSQNNKPRVGRPATRPMCNGIFNYSLCRCPLVSRKRKQLDRCNRPGCSKTKTAGERGDVVQDDDMVFALLNSVPNFDGKPRPRDKLAATLWRTEGDQVRTSIKRLTVKVAFCGAEPFNSTDLDGIARPALVSNIGTLGRYVGGFLMNEEQPKCNAMYFDPYPLHTYAVRLLQRWFRRLRRSRIMMTVAAVIREDTTHATIKAAYAALDASVCMAVKIFNDRLLPYTDPELIGQKAFDPVTGVATMSDDRKRRMSVETILDETESKYAAKKIKGAESNASGGRSISYGVSTSSGVVWPAPLPLEAAVCTEGALNAPIASVIATHWCQFYPSASACGYTEVRWFSVTKYAVKSTNTLHVPILGMHKKNKDRHGRALKCITTGAEFSMMGVKRTVVSVDGPMVTFAPALPDGSVCNRHVRFCWRIQNEESLYAQGYRVRIRNTLTPELF